MSTSAPLPSPRKLKAHDVLRTNSVDQVSSMLTALIIMVGLAVVLLTLLYIFSTWESRPGELVLEVERVAGRGDHAEGFERDMDPPGAEEVEELMEPSLEQTLEAMTEALSTVAASLDSLDAAIASSPGTGQGDSRPPGPLGEGDDIIGRWERWELKFTSRNIQSYASQLDFYKIELGAIGGTTTADYASGFNGAVKTRQGPSEAEKRLYFMWSDENQISQYDNDLLRRSGINIEKRMVLKFIPKELEEELAQTEMRFAIQELGKQIPVKYIMKTVFESKPKTTGGAEFVVIQQSYRLRSQLDKFLAAGE